MRGRSIGGTTLFFTLASDNAEETPCFRAEAPRRDKSFAVTALHHKGRLSETVRLFRPHHSYISIVWEKNGFVKRKIGISSKYRK